MFCYGISHFVINVIYVWSIFSLDVETLFMVSGYHVQLITYVGDCDQLLPFQIIWFVNGKTQTNI